MILLIIVVKWGRFYPLGPSLGGGWGRGVEFPRSTSYEKHTYQFSDFYLQDCDFTYNCSQMGVILPPGTLPWGWGGWRRGVEFPRSASYDKHTYQFSASYLQDCDFTYNCSQMGAILPPGLGAGS